MLMSDGMHPAGSSVEMCWLVADMMEHGNVTDTNEAYEDARGGHEKRRHVDGRHKNNGRVVGRHVNGGSDHAFGRHQPQGDSTGSKQSSS